MSLVEILVVGVVGLVVTWVVAWLLLKAASRHTEEPQ